MADVQSTVEYREIKGFPGYRVGDDGSVWSCKNARHGFRNSWKCLKPRPTTQGYQRYSLCRGGKPYDRMGHHLVLEAFVGPCPLGMEACHKNGVRTDNRRTNLRWDTHQANVDDRLKHGTDNRGQKHHHAKLNDRKVRRIKAMVASGRYTHKEISGIMGIVRTTITKIASGSAWSHVT